MGYRIGIAPFAAYETKMYPLDLMKEVVRALCAHVENGGNFSRQGQIQVFLFGGGKREKEILDRLVQEVKEVQEVQEAQGVQGVQGVQKVQMANSQQPTANSQIENMCGRFGGLKEELEFMKTLDVMLCMDSGNLHMATLMGVKTVSVWGATHPKMGFAPEETVVVQDETLECRPCSVYGNKPCKYGDMRCMRGISPKAIVQKVLEVLEV